MPSKKGHPHGKYVPLVYCCIYLFVTHFNFLLLPLCKSEQQGKRSQAQDVLSQINPPKQLGFDNMGAVVHRNMTSQWFGRGRSEGGDAWFWWSGIR